MNIKNYIFPIVLGSEEVNNLVSYRLYEDGIYLNKRLPGGGELSFKVDGLPGVGKGTEGIKFLHRSIPFSFYTTIIDFFKHVCNTLGSKLEAYAFIGYSTKEDRYCIYIPEQKVTVGSVQCTSIDKFFKEWHGYHIVMDLHQHAFLSIEQEPNFSPVDNANDINDRFSCVIGNPFALYPKAKFRFGANGRFWEYSIDDLFENTNETFKLDFDKEISKITPPISGSVITSSPSVSCNLFNLVREENFFDKYIKGKKCDTNFSINDLLGKDW